MPDFVHTPIFQTLRILHRRIFYTNDGSDVLLFDLYTKVDEGNFDFLPHMRENGPRSLSIDEFMFREALFLRNITTSKSKF